MMTTIRVLEIESILKKMNNTSVFSRAKADAVKLVKDYVDGIRNLAGNAFMVRLFFKLVCALDSGDLKTAAITKLEQNYPNVMNKEKSKKFKFLRKRAKNPDEVELDFCRESLQIYRQMGLISKKNYEKFVNCVDLHEIDKFLATVKLNSHNQELKFAEIFVTNHKDNLSVVPPIILARAHESLKNKVASGCRGNMEVLLNDVLIRMDELISDFSTYENVDNFRPSSKTQNISNFIDITNVARIYDGYRAVFEQRLTWLPGHSESQLSKDLRRNITNIDKVMSEYDNEWGLTTFRADEKYIVNQYSKLNEIVKSFQVFDNVKEKLSHYEFIDKNKCVSKNFLYSDGTVGCEYRSGVDINPNSRMGYIIELIRYELVLKNMAKFGAKSDNKKLEIDFNNAILLKISDMAAKGKGDNNVISDKIFEKEKSDYVAQIADFAARLNSKFNSVGESFKTNLLSRLFEPVQNIDSRYNARFQNETGNNKLEFFKRIFKTFASSFLTSAAITAISVGLSTLAGISLTTGIAVIGISTSIAMSYFQIKKWQKNQIALNQPSDIKALIHDKRIMLTLGTTGLAAIGMVFGAFGLNAVMASMGYSSIAIGGTTASVQVFNDAKSKGMNNTLAASLAIGNLLAAVTGGLIGRTVVKSFANCNGMANTDNNFAKSGEHIEQQNVIQQPEQTYHEETRYEYTQSGLDNAKRIADMFYQDNPELLQKHVEMVEQYNAAHGTNIDPYRAAILRADAGGHVPSNYEIAIDNHGGTRWTNGNVKVFGQGWTADHPEFSVEDIKAAKAVFDSGIADETGMKVIERLDHIVSERNQVGVVSAPIATVNGVNTYSNGPSVFAETKVMVPNEVVASEQHASVFEPELSANLNDTQVNGGIGMVGTFAPKKRGLFKRLRDRMGSFMDSIFVQKERMS